MKVVGLMSGTSVDGIDAALVEIQGQKEHPQVQLLAGETYPYPPQLREQILAICAGEPLTLEQYTDLDDRIAQSFANAVLNLQKQSDRRADLIGSHGQTLYHRPPQKQRPIPLGYTLQFGRGEAISHLTGIPTVSNFRAADIAARGEGAPLVSKVDAVLLAHPHHSRCIQNIGGIANLTYLPPRNTPQWEQQICGWDTGPGNALLDLAISQLTNGKQTCDRGGQWAARGTPNPQLLAHWLSHPYFHTAPPKSTGRELFGTSFLKQCWQDARDRQLSDADWLATLTDLTTLAIANDYRQFLPQMPGEVLLCGGGRHNHYLRTRLQTHLAPIPVLTTDDIGLDGDYKEAIAFAVLAYWRWHQVPGNLPAVTGAKTPVLLGQIHPIPE